MEPAEYDRFKQQIGKYLSTDITFEILANFLRQNSRFQKCFQICRDCHGRKQWIEAELAYAYEHSGPYKIGDSTREKLLAEIDCDEFYNDPIPDRICLPKLEEFFKNNPIQHYDADSMAKLGEKLECRNEQKNEMLCELARFVHLDPEFPDIGKKVSNPWKKIELTPGMTREKIIGYVESVRTENRSADLAFYALRDLSKTDWTPFLKAALERNPVCIEGTKTLSDEELIQWLNRSPQPGSAGGVALPEDLNQTGGASLSARAALGSESIYDGPRLAQPDEVWNFKTGDGVEKAILLSNVWKKRHPDEKTELTVQPDQVELKLAGQAVVLKSSKGLTTDLTL
jgi:hypothetical protein